MSAVSQLHLAADVPWCVHMRHATLNSNSGRGSVTRIEINGLRLVPPLSNLLLLGHVCLACVSTVSIKTSEDELKIISFAKKRTLNTVPFRKCLKLRKNEEAVYEARTTSGAQGERVKLVLTSPRRLVSTRPGRHQRAQVIELREEHVTLAILSLD